MASKIHLTLSNGQKMPAIGLGTWQANKEGETERALNAALEKGYRHIDTALTYQTEPAVGKVLKEWISSGKVKREDIFISTKLPIVGLHPDRVEFFLKRSLVNLQLDYIDLYLIHFPIGSDYVEGSIRPPVKQNGETDFFPKTDRIAVWKKMEEQVDLGRAKNIGLSNFNISQIQDILNSARIKPANLQIELHVYLQQHQLVNFCHQNGITVVAYAPLGTPGYNNFLGSRISQAKVLPDILNDEVIRKLSEKYSKSPAQIALRFLLQRGVAAIPKSVTPKRIEENIEVFDFALTEEEMKTLYSLDRGEAARICDFVVYPGVKNHPEYPFK